MIPKYTVLLVFGYKFVSCITVSVRSTIVAKPKPVWAGFIVTTVCCSACNISSRHGERMNVVLVQLLWRYREVKPGFGERGRCSVLAHCTNSSLVVFSSFFVDLVENPLIIKISFLNCPVFRMHFPAKFRHIRFREHFMRQQISWGYIVISFCRAAWAAASAFICKQKRLRWFWRGPARIFHHLRCSEGGDMLFPGMEKALREVEYDNTCYLEWKILCLVCS